MDKKDHALIPWKPASGAPAEPTLKQRREAAALKHFAKEEQRQEMSRLQQRELELISALCMRERQHNIIYEALRKRSQERRIKEMYDLAVHASVQARWKDRNEEDSSTLLVLDTKESLKRQYEQEVVKSNIEDDIKAFEKKGYELGPDDVDVPGQSADKKKTKDSKPPSKLGKGSKKEDDSSRPVDLALLAQQGNAYLEEVKARKAKEQEERLQQQQTKAKEALEQKQRAIEELEAAKRAEEDMLGSQKNEEARRLEEVLKMAEAEEQSFIAYRKLYEQQITEQRRREWDAVLAHDRELLLMMREDCVNEIEHEQQILQEEKQRRMESKKRKHKETCEETLQKVLAVVETVISYKENTDTNVPPLEWREWKSLFIKGAILSGQVGGEVEEESPENVLIADEASMMEYFQEDGEWKGPEKIGKNLDLGKILDTIYTLADSPAKPSLPDLSKIKLKLSIVGTPFSGKTTVARRLEEDFGVVRIEVEKLISLAVDEACTESAGGLPKVDIQGKNKQNEITNEAIEVVEPKESGTPEEIMKPLSTSEIGRKIQSYLQQGLQVPDDLIIQLLVLTISKLGENENRNQDQKKPKGNNSAAKKGKDTKKTGESNDTVNMGFIIDGFPSTIGQAEQLEKALTGLDLAFVAQHRAMASKLCPPPDPPPEILVSGFDGIFLIREVDDQFSLQSALGKRVDPKTGVLYHLDYQPPPDNDKTGISGRLKAIEEPETARLRITAGRMSYSPLVSWLCKFENAYWIEHDEIGRVVTEDAAKIVRGFVEAKKQAEAVEAAARLAKEANEAATQALQDAEKAKIGVECAGKQLYMAKLAEIEAISILESMKSDPLANEVLKGKASISAAQKLNEAIKAMKDVKIAAEAAQRAAESAQKAAEVAVSSAANTAACFEAQAAADVAAQAAKQASLKASATCQKAGFIYEQSADSLAAIDPAIQKDISVLTKPVEEATDESQEVIPEDRMNIIKTPILDLETAASLHAKWTEIEKVYFEKLRQAFHQVRTERTKGRSQLMKAKSEFRDFLKRTDTKQKVFDDFQGKYNRVETMQRRTPKMKSKLKTMVEELGKKLQNICDTRLKEAQAQQKVVLDQWSGQSVSAIVSMFTSIVQVEIDRYLQCCGFLHEYYFQKPKSTITDSYTNTISLTEVAGSPPKTFPIPGWVSSIMTSCPPLYQVLAKAVFLADNILRDASNPPPDPMQAGSKKGKQASDLKSGGRGAKSKGGMDAPTTIPEFLREYQIIIGRFQLIVRKACAYIIELQPLLEGASRRMEELVNRCYQAETQVTGEVIELANEAVEECIPLWYQMQLGGQQLDIIEDQIVMEETPPPPGFHPLVDLSNWHFRLPENLANLFSALSPTGYIKAEEIIMAIQREAEALHEAFINDTNFSQIPRLPATKARPLGPFQLWIEYGDEINSCATMEKDRPQVVDWRALIVALIDMHFNYCISASSLENVKDICCHLQERTLESDGCLTLEDILETQFWFDTDSNQEDFKLGVKIKNLCYTMLKNEDQLVSWRRLMLYLCRDEDKEIALLKVFAVLAGDRPELKQEELLAAIYHGNMQEARSVGCATWTDADLDELLTNMEREKEKSKQDFDMEQDPTSSVCSEMTLRQSIQTQRGSEISEQVPSIIQELLEAQERSRVAEEDNVSLSDLSEGTANLIRDFLSACTDVSDEISELSEQSAAIVYEFLKQCMDEEKEPKEYKVEDILKSECSETFRAALLEIYSSKHVYFMNVNLVSHGEPQEEKFESSAIEKTEQGRSASFLRN